MLEDITLLIRLQQIDSQITEIEMEKGDLPEQIDNLTRELNEVRASIEDIDQQLDRIEINKRQHNLNILKAKDRLKKSKGVLFNVKTNREYDAISSEMEHSKNLITDSERLLTELANEENRLKATKAEWEEKRSVLGSEFEDKSNDMREFLSQSQGKETELNQERQEIIRQLKSPIYNHYERIRKLREGVGVASIDGSACGYCFSIVPPQQLANIKTMTDVFICETCGCFLVDAETVSL